MTKISYAECDQYSIIDYGDRIEAVCIGSITSSTNLGSIRTSTNIVLAASLGTVSFKHTNHAGCDCTSCHVGEASPGRISQLSKEWAHMTCKGCHAEIKRGPTSCKGCHNKNESSGYTYSPTTSSASISSTPSNNTSVIYVETSKPQIGKKSSINSDEDAKYKLDRMQNREDANHHDPLNDKLHTLKRNETHIIRLNE